MAIKESSGSKNDPCMHAVLSEALSSILSCPYFSLEQVVLCPKKKKKKKNPLLGKNELFESECIPIASSETSDLEK